MNTWSFLKILLEYIVGTLKPLIPIIPVTISVSKFVRGGPDEIRLLAGEIGAKLLNLNFTVHVFQHG
jgi:hypothetical protein